MFDRLRAQFHFQTGLAALHRAISGDPSHAQTAIEHFQRARPYYEAQGMAGAVNANEATAWRVLATCREPEQNLRQAIRLFERAREDFAAEPQGLAMVLVNLADARRILAELIGNEAANLTEAVADCQRARQLLPAKEGVEWGKTLVCEANVRYVLAEHGRDARAHLREAISLLREARQHVSRSPQDMGNAWMNSARARLLLAELGGDKTKDNLTEAMHEFEQAAAFVRRPSPDYGRLCMNMSRAVQLLAEHDPDPAARFEQSIGLCREARRCHPAESYEAGRTAVNEAGARAGLALLQINQGEHAAAIDNLNETATLCDQARNCFPAGGRAGLLMNVAAAHRKLSEVAADETCRADHRTQAIEIYGDAAADAEAAGHLSLVPRTRTARARMLTPIDPQAALADYEAAQRAVEIARHAIPDEQQRRAFLDEQIRLYREAVELCLAMDRPVEAWHWLSRGRIRTFLDLLRSPRRRFDTDEQRQAFELWQTAQQKLAAEATKLEAQATRTLRDWEREFRAASDPDVVERKLAADVDHLRKMQSAISQQQDRVEQLRDRFARTARSDADLLVGHTPSPTETVRALRDLALPENRGTDANAESKRTLLVEFNLHADDSYTVFLLPLWKSHHDDVPLQVVRVQLESGAIETLTMEFAAAWVGARMAFGNANRATLTKDDYAAAGRLLGGVQEPAAVLEQFARLPEAIGAALLKPWASNLNDLAPTDLILVGHSLLHLLPLHAGHCEANMPLICKYPLVYLPAATMAADLVERRKRPAPTDGRPLVMGPPPESGLDKMEADLVGKHYFGVAPHSLEAMTVSALCEHGATATLVHLVTHSHVVGPDLMSSSIQFHHEDLLLARLLHDPALQMPHVDFWYQGSCESAASQPGPSNELIGFVRALFCVGARSVMATFCPIDDLASRKFAQRFYAHCLRHGLTKAAAWQATVCDLISGRYNAPEGVDLSNPYNWAPFALFGDGFNHLPGQGEMYDG